MQAAAEGNVWVCDPVAAGISEESQARANTKGHADVPSLHCCIMHCIEGPSPLAIHHAWESGPCPSSAVGWHGKGRNALTSYPHPVPIADGRTTIPKFMGLGELVPPLTIGSTWETGPCISPEQHSSTGPGCRSAGEPPSEQHSRTGPMLKMVSQLKDMRA